MRGAQARQVAGMVRGTISVGLSVRHDVESLRDPASPFETNMHTAAIGKPNIKASVLRRSWPSCLPIARSSTRHRLELKPAPRAAAALRRAQALRHPNSDALTKGGNDGQGLSPRSVVMMHRTLSQSLKHAVIWRLRGDNPASFCKPPRVERKEMKVLNLDSTASLIEFARGGRLYIPILFFALCGLRRAEVAALRWNRLDLDAHRLSILTSIEQTAQGMREKPPKTGKARSIALPALIVEELRRHRISQAQQLLALGVRQTDDTPHLPPRGRRPLAAARADLRLQADPCQRAYQGPPARSATWPRYAPPSRQHAPQGRSGTAGPCEHPVDARHLQPRKRT